ncbi:MAG TPA: YqaE/Pmp3 family membrane protein [Bacteroidia bacterium]
MKKTNGILAFAALMILLSSCGSLSISQKRYSRGLNIDWFSKKDEPRKTPQPKIKKVKEAPAENAVAENIPATQEFESVEDIQTDQNFQDNSTATETQSAPAQSNATNVKKHDKASKRTAAFKAKELRKELKQKLNVSKKTEAGTESDSDDNLILLVILAILLPPLAVYLFYGSAETHFWINLILWLLFGGLWIGSGFAFGIGIAVIHALLVIFEVIG